MAIGPPSSCREPTHTPRERLQIHNWTSYPTNWWGTVGEPHALYTLHAEPRAGSAMSSVRYRVATTVHVPPPPQYCLRERSVVHRQSFHFDTEDTRIRQPTGNCFTHRTAARETKRTN